VKITSVDVYQVRAKWRRGWNPVIIRVNTDEGVNGWGEAGVAVGGGTNAYAAIVRDLTEMHLLGADPLKLEALWEKMFRRTWLSQGGGPVIYRGPNMNPVVVERLAAAAKKAKIECQWGACGRGSGTDANAIQLSRAGVAAGLVSVPNRYMHSAVEMISLDDIDQCANLLAEFALGLKADTDFTPR